MIRCPECDSFVPLRAELCSCPECGHVASVVSTLAARPSAKRLGLVERAKNTALGVTTVMTLMACYGVPYEPGSPRGCSDPADDRDGDGYCGALDCNESDPTVNYYAFDEPGDGVDRNCDGVDGRRLDAGPGDAG